MENKVISISEMVDRVKALAIGTAQLSRRVDNGMAGQLVMKGCIDSVLSAGTQLAAVPRNGRVHLDEPLSELRRAIFCFELLLEASLAPQSDVLPLLDSAHQSCALLQKAQASSAGQHE